MRIRKAAYAKDEILAIGSQIDTRQEAILMYKLWNTLNDLKQYRWVELSHSLNNDSPYWAGIPEGSVELSKTVFDWGNPMLECLIQTFKFPGQFGTHIDFPGHFVKGAPLSESYGLSHMVYPLCVIDITDRWPRMSTTQSSQMTSATMNRSTAPFPTAHL